MARANVSASFLYSAIKRVTCPAKYSTCSRKVAISPADLDALAGLPGRVPLAEQVVGRGRALVAGVSPNGPERSGGGGRLDTSSLCLAYTAAFKSDRKCP